MKLLSDFRRKLRRRRRERSKIQLSELEETTQENLAWSTLRSSKTPVELKTKEIEKPESPQVVQLDIDTLRRPKKPKITSARPHERIERAFRQLEQQARNVQPS